MTLDPIEQMVAELRWEATPDSSGEFSMTSSAALEKLAKFQLRAPERYVLAAVAAGCAAGATEIAITVHPDSCKIEMLGWLDVQVEALSGLFTSLFSSDPSLTPLRYLARAVLGAAGLNPYYVSLHVTKSDGKDGGSLRLTGNRFTSVNSRGRGRPGLCMFVQEHANAGVFQRLFGGLMGAQSPTLELLRASCSFSSIPIHVNGKPIACLPRLGACEQVWKFGDVAGDWRGTPTVRELPEQAGLRALIGWSLKPAWGCACAVVVHGVHYQLQPKTFGPNHTRGVIWYDGARLDLSLENIVEDEQWNTRLNSLKELYESGTRSHRPGL
ncbi:MAG: hypothetical protein U0931_23760 [Vulcanimicrobiota bacterium]